MWLLELLTFISLYLTFWRTFLHNLIFKYDIVLGVYVMVPCMNKAASSWHSSEINDLKVQGCSCGNLYYHYGDYIFKNPNCTLFSLRTYICEMIKSYLHPNTELLFDRANMILWHLDWPDCLTLFVGSFCLQKFCYRSGSTLLVSGVFCA